MAHDGGVDGCLGDLSRDSATIAEVLKGNGCQARAVRCGARPWDEIPRLRSRSRGGT